MSKKFDKLLEMATDSTLLEPNWDAIIACFDSVRAGEVPGKAAMIALRKRIQHDNPHVVMHALLVLDACVKNCGQKIHEEVATREFMEEFKNLGIESKYEEVKNKVLEMLQCWAMAFANKPEYKIVVDTHNLMKLAGFDFPSIKEAEAMFMAQVAPEWQDGNECYRCRSEFGLLTRKHHCRACGQIFCDRCSSHEMTLPQFGIEKEVRVCDSCFDSARPPTDKHPHPKSKGDAKVVSSEVSQEEKDKLLREKEEEDLALALAMSKSEAEAKEQDRQKNMFSMYNGNSDSNNQEAASLSSYPPSEIGYKGVAASGGSLLGAGESDQSVSADDPLARYLNRDYWQSRKNNGATSQNKVDEWASSGGGASAPLPSDCSLPSGPATLVDEPLSLMTLDGVSDAAPVNDAHTQQITEATVKWCKEVSEQVGVMESRVRSNMARGRSVVNDSAIQGLFLRLTELHSQVLDRMGKLDEERGYFEGLQDHIAHIKDARSAVDELREESERKRQERLAEEQRMRQTQMKQTLDMMRLKKHTMLMEQRDMALQRFQQQEQEMQARRMQQPYYPPSSGYAPPHMPISQYSQAPGMYNQQQQLPGYYQQPVAAHAHQPYSQQAPPPLQTHQPQYSMPSSYPQPAGGYSHPHQQLPPVSQAAPTPHMQYGNQPQQQNYYEQKQYQQQQYGQQPQSTVAAAAPSPMSHPTYNAPMPTAHSDVPSQPTAAPVAEAALISFD